MGKKKTLIVLLIVFAVMCVAAFAASKYEKHKENINSTEETVIEVSPEDVTSVSWSTDVSSLGFTKDEDGNWTYDGDSAFPVDADTLNDMLDIFSEFKTAFTITDVEDYGQYGLDDPTGDIKITTDSDTYEIKLGDFSKIDEKRYISINDGDVYLVETDPYDTYAVELSSIIKNDEVPSIDQASVFTVEGVDSYTAEYDDASDDSYCPEDVYFTDSKPLDTDKVNDYMDLVSALSLTDYATYTASSENLSTYGLDDPELTMAITYTGTDEDGNDTNGTFTYSIGRNAEEVAAYEAQESADAAKGDSDSSDSDSEEDDTPTVYLRVGDSEIIYEISETSYENLIAASYNDLRHDSVWTGDIDGVSGIEVTLDDASYTFSNSKALTREELAKEYTKDSSDTDSDSDEETESTWTYDGETFDPANLVSKLKAVAVEDAEDFTSEKASGKEEIKLVLSLNDTYFPTVTISLYRVDGEKCLAVINGKTFGYVSRDDVVAIEEAVNSLVL